MTPPGGPSIPTMLHAATARLVRTVDGLTDADWSTPSLLPGWSRGHVVAHLMLNAEALAGVLEGVREGLEVTMYASQDARDADIHACSRLSPGILRDRFMGACHRVEVAVTGLPEELRGVRVRRTPGAPPAFNAGRVGEMRLREVEIHHADLGAAYSWADWPAAFSTFLLHTRAQVHDGSPFTARAVDLDTSFEFGEGGPTVSGPAGQLGWWVTGRDPGDGLISDSGELPRMETW